MFLSIASVQKRSIHSIFAELSATVHRYVGLETNGVVAIMAVNLETGRPSSKMLLHQI
ncbi:hypothetical protein Plhal304r1_c022g0077591 [Plasmopara halstedii]